MHVLRDDPVTQLRAGSEKAVGSSTQGCPWKAYRDPFVGAVLRAYRHWKEHQLGLLYPDPPAALIAGIEAYDAALNAVQAHDIREEREVREKERRKREMSPTQPARRR